MSIRSPKDKNVSTDSILGSGRLNSLTVKLAVQRVNHAHPLIEEREDGVGLLRRQAGRDPVHPDIAVALYLIEVGLLAADRDVHRVGIAAGLGAHLAKARDELDKRRRALVSNLRHPAVAVAQSAARRIRKGAAHEDRRMRTLNRLGPGHNRIEVHEIAVIL